MAERATTQDASDPPGPMRGPDPPEPRAGDYYAILGVSAAASLPALKQAYHREAKLWHPDRFAAAEPDLYARAERRMRQLTEAYHTLSDPDARAAYDASLRGDGVTSTSPGGVSSSIVGGYASGVAHHRYPADHATDNPNGAGQFFAALAVVVGLALLAGIAQGGAISDGPTTIVLFGLAIILAVSAAIFMAESPASRWATRVMEGEPRGYEPPRQKAHAPPPTGAAATSPGPEDDSSRFERLVSEALDTVPAEFAPYMRNIVVEVEEEPSAETLRQSGVPEGYTLLGLYRGVPLDKRGMAETGPDIISIFRGPIERHSAGDPERIREQVRATTLHELAHHFGIEHEEMPDWVK